MDKLLKPAIGIALALVAYQFIRGLGNGIQRVSLIDQDAVRAVLYGDSATPYAVLCHGEDSTAPLSSVFSDAYKEAASPAVFRVVDCNAVLPTEGKTIAEHLKLNLDKRPTIFVTGGAIGQGKAQQVPDKHLKTGSLLTKYLRLVLEKRAAKIETTQDLRTKCLDKPVCGLLLKGGKKVASSAVKDAMTKLVNEYPDAALAAVDDSVLYVLHLEEYLTEFAPNQSRFVVFRKVSGGTTTKDSGRLITSMKVVEPVAYGPMSNALAEVLRGTATDLQKLSSLPQIKTRTKKLEEAERAKRQRKAEQKRRQAEGSSSSSSTSFSTEGSDDMKEERRRERERRRAEHNARNNVKPKTPEELAEMERKRRERMEEEARKWNMAPDDAPPEGEYDSGESYMFEDMDEDTVVVEDVADDEDDEDVIDLD